MTDLHSITWCRKAYWLPLACFATAWLLPCGLEAQVPGDKPRGSYVPATQSRGTVPKKPAPRTTATRPALATVSSGPFKISVEDIRRVKGKPTVALEDNGFPIQANILKEENKGDGSSFSTHSSGGSGGGRASGGGASGAWGGTVDIDHLNLVVDLRVSGPKNNPNHLLCAVLGKVDAKDNGGAAINTPDLPAHLKVALSDFDYPEGSGYAAVHLNLENENARSLKSLAGDLLVMNARIQTTSFEGREFNAAVTRQLKGVQVRLEKVEITEKGIRIAAGVSMPNPFTDKLNFHNMKDRLRVVLEDSKGMIHEPRTATGGSSSSGGGGGTFSSSGGGMRRGGRGGPGESLPMASYNLSFAPLPEGVSMRKISCTVTELLSTPQRVAFRFNDLPLPPAAAAGSRE